MRFGDVKSENESNVQSNTKEELVARVTMSVVALNGCRWHGEAE